MTSESDHRLPDWLLADACSDLREQIIAVRVINLNTYLLLDLRAVGEAQAELRRVLFSELREALSRHTDWYVDVVDGDDTIAVWSRLAADDEDRIIDHLFHQVPAILQPLALAEGATVVMLHEYETLVAVGLEVTGHKLIFRLPRGFTDDDHFLYQYLVRSLEWLSNATVSRVVGYDDLYEVAVSLDLPVTSLSGFARRRLEDDVLHALANQACHANTGLCPVFRVIRSTSSPGTK